MEKRARQGSRQCHAGQARLVPRSGPREDLEYYRRWRPVLDGSHLGRESLEHGLCSNIHGGPPVGIKKGGVGCNEPVDPGQSSSREGGGIARGGDTPRVGQDIILDVFLGKTARMVTEHSSWMVYSACIEHLQASQISLDRRPPNLRMPSITVLSTAGHPLQISRLFCRPFPAVQMAPRLFPTPSDPARRGWASRATQAW